MAGTGQTEGRQRADRKHAAGRQRVGRGRAEPTAARKVTHTRTHTRLPRPGALRPCTHDGCIPRGLHKPQTVHREGQRLPLARVQCTAGRNRDMGRRLDELGWRQAPRARRIRMQARVSGWVLQGHVCLHFVTYASMGSSRSFEVTGLTAPAMVRRVASLRQPRHKRQVSQCCTQEGEVRMQGEGVRESERECVRECVRERGGEREGSTVLQRDAPQHT
jgi:hypothetical protein